MKQETGILVRENELFLNTYHRIPLEFSHGEGVYLFTKDGEKYLDFFSGLAVNALGYGHQGVVDAVNSQASKYIHLSNFYASEAQLQLAEMLIKYSGMSRVFFTNSGTEAIEVALKAVRKKSGADKKIFSLSNSFHGRTFGALSLTAKEDYKKEFKPFLPNIYHLPFNDVSELENNINEKTGSVFIEFIQGEGGINIVSREYIDVLTRLRLKYKFSVVADEVQSGFGRAGKTFAFDHFNFKPDLVVVAKALGGGFPLGALLTSGKFKDVFSPGDHGSTFGGNPVACAAGVVVLKEIFESGLIDEVNQNGKYFMSQLVKLKTKHQDKIREVRGFGFMIGIEMNFNCSPIVEEMREQKVLVNCTSGNVFRILPPLISKKEDIDYFLAVFSGILK